MIVWTPRTDDQPSLAMGAIAFAPSDSRFVYAGTGEPNVIVQSYAGRGLLKSLDGGSSWSLVAASPFAGTSFSDIRVHQSNPNVLVAATVQGTAGQSETPVRWGPSPGSSSATTGALQYGRRHATLATASTATSFTANGVPRGGTTFG
jgi:hypothetical protein